MHILGINIDNIALPEVLNKVREFLHTQKQHYIVTINPEFIMAARKDDEFKNILNKADLSVADGKGIVFAARRYGNKLQGRITGVDLLWKICEVAQEEGRSIFLLGSKRGVPDQAAEKIKERYQNIRIVGAECGYRHWHRHIKDEQLVKMINRRGPDILFVAFGQVKQEKWIYHNLPKLSSVKLAMGVGGSFDFISGNVKRAPQWMRSIGLEWLYRLMRQPWRLPRIITAVVRFSGAVLLHKQK